MTELHDLTATEQVRALAARDISSRELTEHYLARVDRHNRELAAFITVDADQALDAAAARDACPGSGLLDGLPVGIKDLHPTVGMPTTFGSAALAEHLAPHDDPVVARLRSSGAVVIGKTNTCEFGPACYTDTVVGGNCVTPWNTALSASGSSGGTASAIAAGLLPVSPGSDGLGSIRTPAANCGLVGFKPSRGRYAGSGGTFFALATQGPIGRTVADVELLLAAMGPPAPHALWCEPDRVERALDRPLRIAVQRDPGIEVELDLECGKALDIAIATLSGLGHDTEELPDLPPEARIDAIAAALLTTTRASVGLAVDNLIPLHARDLLMPYTQWLLEETPTGSQLLAAQAGLASAAAAYAAHWADYDLLLTPTTTAPPQATADIRADDGPASLWRMLQWSAFTPWANLTGAPALSLPLHRSGDDLPVGVQITARRHDDELLLSLAGRIEAAHRWDRAHPEIWYR